MKPYIKHMLLFLMILVTVLMAVELPAQAAPAFHAQNRKRFPVVYP